MSKIQLPVINGAYQHKLPQYETSSAAGMDVRANIESDTLLKPGDRILISTGIKIAIPEGFELQVRPRSGLALKHGITVLNAPGTIDACYRGEIGVILINHSTEDFTVQPGMRVAQLVLSSFVQLEWVEVSDLPATTRGEGGFGSTGLD